MNVLGLGIDVVEISRMERMIERDRRFVERVFSPDEISFCDGQSRPAECYAARWAAREACAKALGGIPEGRWSDIRVIKRDDGVVLLALDGEARERAAAVGADRVLLSFAHESSHAVACCVAVGP